jgi:hypothetical protein
MDLRILAFPVVWALLAVAEYAAIVWSQRSTRQSAASGYVTRVVSSLVLAFLGYAAGLHHLVMLGAICCGDYRALGPSLGWIVWAGAAVAALVPWTAWAIDLLISSRKSKFIGRSDSAVSKSN